MTAVPATRIGDNLFVAVVTARAAGAGDELAPGQLYAYDLEATTSSGSFTSLRNTGFFSRPGENYANSQLAFPGMIGVDTILAGLPTFVLPAATPDGLRILHGSCRKPHANSLDALALVDRQLLESASSATSRPQQLVLTGDQVYGDDVGDTLMALIREAAPVLVGTENLPGVPADQLNVGNRGPLMVANGITYGKSHLITFGEYASNVPLRLVRHPVAPGRRADPRLPAGVRRQPDLH